MLNTVQVLFAMEMTKALCCLPTQKASFLFLIYRITITFLGWSQNIKQSRATFTDHASFK